MRAGDTGHVTCVLCPKGCRIAFERTDEGYHFTGGGCPKGEEYARKEIVNPERILTSTVKTVFPDFPRLPVKTDREIPLERVYEYMKAVNGVCVRTRCLPGEIVSYDLLNTGVNLLATAAMTGCDGGTKEGPQ
jgi:CxxC motif-containing protein